MTETNGSEAGSPGTLERTLEELQRYTARINAEHYRLGRLIVEMMDQKQEGMPTYTRALKELGLSVASMAKKEFTSACKAARHFSEETCVKYGVRRLALLMDYQRKSEQKWAHEEPGPVLIRLPDAAGAAQFKTFAECSIEDLGRAIASAGKWPGPKPAPREDEYCVHLLKQGLQRRFAEDSSASIKAFLQKGRMHVNLQNVCVRELGFLQSAIRESLIRLEEEKKRTSASPRRPVVPAAALCLSQLGKAPVAAAVLRAP